LRVNHPANLSLAYLQDVLPYDSESFQSLNTIESVILED
jgi:hypothetical protein